jgi:hypothetical protein
MIRRFPGGSASLAARMGMSPTTLAHKASPTDPRQFFSPEEVMELTEETNDNDFVNAVCAARGGMFMPTAEGLDGLTDDKLVEVMRECSQFVSALADARTKASPGGRNVTANELNEIEREAAEAIAVIQEGVRRARADHQAAKAPFAD